MLRPSGRLALLLALLPALSGAPGTLSGQLPPPHEVWRTLRTEHFRITYPEPLLELAQRAGERAETAHRLLSREFVPPPRGVIDLLVTDHADISNGFSRVFPSNRIVIFAPPPVDGFSLAFMDEWLELVITHEVAHIFHLDGAGPLGRGLRRVFGRFPAPWPFFPGTATPVWTMEGIATYYESSLTHAGRVRGSYHEMILRTAILEGAFERIDQSSGNAPLWPGGERYYVYGSRFFAYLLERHGPETMGRFVRAVEGQWIPFRLDAAARKAVGVSFTGAWEAWREELEHRYAALRDSLARHAPLTRGERLAPSGYYALNPAPSPDGEVVAFARFDGRSDAQIRLVQVGEGGEEFLLRTNSLANMAWTPGGELLFSQTEYLDSYRIRGDLWLAHRDGGARRLTRGERLDHPHVHPGGERAVAVQEEGGTNRLVLVDLSSGALTPLTAYDPLEHWSYPRWSPDGRWIAVSRWHAGGRHQLVLLNPGGEPAVEVTRDRAIDNSPAWSPDGRWLLWASDRSGIPNLHAVEVDPEPGRLGARRQVTNVLGGAAFPSVDPAGRWIYYSSYHADGWHIERIPFRPQEWFEPLPLHPAFHGEVEADRFHRRAEALPEPYRAGPTLRPTYWEPAFREADQVDGVKVLNPAFGFSTSGEDLVGRHAFSLSALFSSGVRRLDGGLSYAWAGLGNPVLQAGLLQTHEAGSRPLPAPDDSGDLLYLVERERQAALGATFLRRRSRTSASLTLAGSHVWEDRSLLEEDLSESRRFRLLSPESRLAEGRASVFWSNARSYPFSVSLEEGALFFLRGRARGERNLADSLQGVAGRDRSFRDAVGQLRLYKGIPGPGFGNHVLALRVSGGVGSGAGADAFHFEVGGASGEGLPVGIGALRGGGLFFPVRGYPTAARYGHRAWSATAEYRFPLALLNRGRGLIPLHLDRLSGALFLDGGNAWGPELGIPRFHSPSRGALASAGGELVLRILPFWFQTLELRGGVALPLREGEGAQGYLRLGPSF